MHVKRDDFAGSLLHASLRRLLRGGLRSFELGFVDTQAKLLRHQSREIDWETVGVVQPPHVLAGKLLLTSLEGLLCVLLEELLATIKST